MQETLERELTVVVVDDDPCIRLLVRRGLEADGRFRVVAEADDGAEAMQLVADLRPDAVVLDLTVPGLPGADGLPRLRDADPDLTVIVLSTPDPASPAAEQARVAGAAAYLQKGRAADLPDVLARCATGGEVAGTG